jgi:MYXO-CTERM domain-containing protein
MSAEQSATKVPPELDPPTDLLYPDLRSQYWYNPADGNSDAVEWSKGLIGNGYWEVGANTLHWSTNPPLAPDDGETMLLNKKIGNNKNESNFSPFFLRDIDKGNKKLKAEVVYYNTSSDKWEYRQETSLEYTKPYWYWVIDAPGTDVPGPLPLLGAGAAFGWSRRLRQRVKQAAVG